MNKHSGIIYETDKGEFGLAIHEEQRKEFLRQNKLYLHIFQDRNCTKPKVVNDKAHATLKDIDKLKMVGYSD